MYGSAEIFFSVTAPTDVTAKTAQDRSDKNFFKRIPPIFMILLRSRAIIYNAIIIITLFQQIVNIFSAFFIEKIKNPRTFPEISIVIIFQSAYAGIR